MSHKQTQKNASSKSGAKGSGSLQDRFREMGAQEQLIEQKKREIESKMQERKRKEQEEVLNKMQAKLMAAKKAEQSRARCSVFKGQTTRNVILINFHNVETARDLDLSNFVILIPEIFVVFVESTYGNLLCL